VVAVGLGPVLVETLYTETYHLSGQFMALLGLGFLCLRFEVLSNLMLTLGDSRGMMWLWAQRAAFLVVALPLVYDALGLGAALIRTALHSLVSVPYLLFRLQGHVGRRMQLENVLWLCAILLCGYLVLAMFPVM
jgi:hypothetical protein